MKKRGSSWGLLFCFLLMGCGDVRFGTPVTDVAKPRLTPLRKPDPRPRITEKFRYAEPSGSLIVVFAFYPTAREHDLWISIRANLEAFADQAARQLRGFSQVHVGVALDATLGNVAPIQWFSVDLRTAAIAASDDPTKDLNAEVERFRTLATKSVAGKFDLFKNSAAWMRSAASLSGLVGPVWSHLVYFRDYPLVTKDDRLQQLAQGRRDLVAALASLGPERFSFSLCSLPAIAPGVAEALSVPPFSVLRRFSIQDWQNADPRVAAQITSAIEAKASNVILTRAPLAAKTRIQIRNRLLSPTEFEISKSTVVIAAPWARSGDEIEVTYETP